jgi:ADP-ribose pyrophosphatase
MRKITSFETVSEAELGRDGFLVLKRFVLRNVYDDGTRSREYHVDYVERPKGLDAVVVAVYRRRSGGAVEVLVRGQLRPSVHLGRQRQAAAVPDGPLPLLSAELVAGLVEPGDRGEEGLRRRAVAEVLEEVGYTVEPEALQRLGEGTFPSAGVIAERHLYFAVDVTGRTPRAPEGDGSPLEDSDVSHWVPLDAAVAACAGGQLSDSKSEIALRRLRERLQS